MMPVLQHHAGYLDMWPWAGRGQVMQVMHDLTYKLKMFTLLHKSVIQM